MDTNARRRKQHKAIVNTHSDLFTHDLTLYKDVPREEVPLAEFEQLAMDRVLLLKIIEQASFKGFKFLSDEYKHSLKEELLKNNLKKYVRLMSGLGGNSEQDFQARRADHISHYILRLAYCRSEELRRWFMNREMDWFKIKFAAQPSSAILKFLLANNLDYKPISLEEKDEVKEQLIQSCFGMTDVLVSITDFYKVPFSDVLSLVKNRKVFLKAGLAYIPTPDLVHCIQSQYRSNLSETLSRMSHHLLRLDDDRLGNLLCSLHSTNTGNEFGSSKNKDGINPEDLDKFSKKHYPMCMRHLHESLKSAHHLKHGGRLVYGLFLKGIGLLHEQAIEFWRQEFTKKMDTDNEKFNKHYLYNFNHQYGKVGRMVDYSPYSCMRIIMGSVGPGDAHGCPFKHFDQSILKSRLNDYGVSSDGIQEILTLASNQHYQIACTKYFELTHNQAPQQSINHPNQYFEESFNLDKEKVAA